MQDFIRPERMEVPEGGIASFLTATVGEWAEADEDMPVSGVAGLKSVADQLAEYGRYEDTYMVHAAEGETVVPMAVFEENPRLKASLFAQMRAMGIDPEQYVVGSDLNSINPVTGQPEFFLKKLFKGLKKAVKKVVKVVKKVAPVALSIGLNFVPGLGAIAASALGSGIGTLAQGGSLRDALKAGAIGGLTAGLFKGVQGGIRGVRANQGFGTGFREGFTSGLPGQPAYTPGAPAPVVESQGIVPGQATTDAITRAPIPTTPQVNMDALTGSMTSPGTALPTADTLVGPTQGFSAPGATSSVTNPAAALAPQMAPPVSAAPPVGMTVPGADPFGANLQGLQSPQLPEAATVSSPLPGDTLNLPTEVPLEQGFVSPVPPPPASVTQFAPTFAPEVVTKQGIGQIFSNIGQTAQDAGGKLKDFFLPNVVKPIDLASNALGMPGATTEELLQKFSLGEVDAALKKAASVIQSGNLNPSLAQRVLPLAALGTAGLAATGAFDEEEVPPDEDPFGFDFQTGFDLLRDNPNIYGLGPTTTNPYKIAKGGQVDNFPRKSGAIAGPGTGTSDDIPAMLSDGEFVMTAKAVRGAGNGSRRKGVRKMYQIMRGFEGAA